MPTIACGIGCKLASQFLTFHANDVADENSRVLLCMVYPLLPSSYPLLIQYNTI